jgi:hypothetical protein
MSPSELQALVKAERLRVAFLFLRDGDGVQQLIRLDEDRLVIGRMPGSELEISWDPRVSGVHAYLERRGIAWVLEDDGLSRNGTFINGERLRGQRTLRDGDVITVGDTAIGYRLPQDQPLNVTVTTPTAAPPEVSDAQRRVLVALCRPLARESVTPGHASAPATNEQISAELFLSLSAVKGHLRLLFGRFGLDEAPQNQKRLLLAERALQSMAVRPADFE